MQINIVFKLKVDSLKKHLDVTVPPQSIISLVAVN